MGFELTLVSHTPLTGVSDPEIVGVELLRAVGYLSPGDEAARDGVPYRLLVDCFLARPAHPWTVDELIRTLGTTRPTLYRHLNKLKSFDLLDEELVRGNDGGAGGQKAYRIRYGSLGKAWRFVETNVELALENYRETVDHLQALLKRDRHRAAASVTGGGSPTRKRGFEMTLRAHVPPLGEGDANRVAAVLFGEVGFLPGKDADEVYDTVPFRLLMGALLERPDRAWTVDELVTFLKTTRPTVYRHLNKLKALDLLEEAQVPGPGEGPNATRKAYRLRYGNLSKAWNFVEANVRVAMENYRRTVDHLDRLHRTRSK